MILSAAALAFFTYAQQQGMSFNSGAESLAQYSSGQRLHGSGSRSVSHK